MLLRLQLLVEHMCVVHRVRDLMDHAVDMPNIDESNTSLPSTNWRYIKAKIEPHPQGTTQRPKGTARSLPPAKRGRFAGAQLVVRFKGGPECSYLICFEGRCWRYPGHWCLHDVLTHLAAVVM